MPAMPEGGEGSGRLPLDLRIPGIISPAVKRKEVNVMGNTIEAMIAMMGFIAGVMVVLTTLWDGESPWRNEEPSLPHAPRTIHPDGERLAA